MLLRVVFLFSNYLSFCGQITHHIYNKQSHLFIVITDKIVIVWVVLKPFRGSLFNARGVEKNAVSSCIIMWFQSLCCMQYTLLVFAWKNEWTVCVCSVYKNFPLLVKCYPTYLQFYDARVKNINDWRTLCKQLGRVLCVVLYATIYIISSYKCGLCCF